MQGSLPSAHTPTEFVSTRSCPLTYINTNNCSVISYLYSFSDKMYPTWWWPQQHWPKHVVDNSYTPDNMVVLWLLYPYRIITLGSNKHNGDYPPWSLRSSYMPKNAVEYEFCSSLNGFCVCVCVCVCVCTNMSNFLIPDRLQHNRPASCVIAQQYSSVTSVSLRSGITQSV